jgi:hypothetical protein
MSNQRVHWQNTMHWHSQLVLDEVRKNQRSGHSEPTGSIIALALYAGSMPVLRMLNDVCGAH